MSPYRRINQNQESTSEVHETLDQPKTVGNYKRNEELLNVFKQRAVQLQQDVSDLVSPSEIEERSE
ncbi:hypothetical protein ACSYAD_19455 [Acaryochloris marina NIES-2412]|uniref:hypothetical protein n=1 Tax=Acaryochloris marina TaxID=155978 RepID=UPI0040581FD8